MASGVMKMSEYVKRRTLVGLWLGQTPDEPCPFEPDDLTLKDNQPTHVLLKYDRIRISQPDEKERRLRIDFDFGKNPVAYIDIEGTGLDTSGTTVTLEQLRGKLEINFSLE